MSLAHHKISLFPGDTPIRRLVQNSRAEREIDSENFSREFSAGTSVVVMDRDGNEGDTGQGLRRGVQG